MACTGDSCPIRCPVPSAARASVAHALLLGGSTAGLVYAAYRYVRERANAPPPPSPTPCYSVFYGTLAHAVSQHQPLELLENAVLVVEHAGGTIVRVERDVAADKVDAIAAELRRGRCAKDGCFAAHVRTVRLAPRQMLVPGFVDTHTHAPQSAFAGMGRIPLLDWLLKYTFPTESKFSDLAFARHVYTRCVRRVLWSGSTTVCYYGTIHTDASVLLAQLCAQAGQRAFVGKVCALLVDRR